jgi:hypothetical protein
MTITVAPKAWANWIAMLCSWRRAEMEEGIHRHGQEERWAKGRKAKISHRKGNNRVEECMYIATPPVL